MSGARSTVLVRRPRRRLLAAGAGLAALGFALAACTSSQGSGATASSGASGSPVSGGTVRVAEPPAVTPNWIWPMASLAFFSVENISNLQQPMYRPLYWFGGDDDQPTLDEGLSVAQPAQYAADGRSVTIHLKPWKWSNGEAVNADDVVFWMHMVKAEKANWAGYVPGAFPDNITKVDKVDASTVRLTLNSRYSSNWFTYNELSQVTPMPMAWDVTSPGAAPGSGGCTQSMARCAAVYRFLTSQAKDQKTYATSKIWSVVDGPWRLGSYDSAGHYSFVPNTSYSGAPKPRLDKVVFLPFTSDSAEYNVIKSGGGVDVGYIPSQDLPPRPANSAVPANNPLGTGFYLLPAYTWSVNYFVPNMQNPQMGPAFRQLYVRQALQETLNQPVDVAKAQQGYGYPNFSPVPVRPASQWLSPAAKQGTPYPFSVDHAKTLLTDHGWTEKGGVMTCTKPGTGTGECGAGIVAGTRLVVHFDYASGTQSLDQSMQQYKSDAARAGIDLAMKQKPFNSVIGEAVPCRSTQSSCSWQVANWGGGWIYAPDYLPTGESLFSTGAGSNSGSYSSPTMDRLVLASERQNGTRPLYTYEDYAAKQLPVIFQANAYAIDAISDHVGGVVVNPLGTLLPEYWYRTK